MQELNKALSEVELARQRGFSKQQVRLLTREIRKLPFASLVAFLAGSSFTPGPNVGEVWIARAASEAAREPEATGRQSDPAAIEELLVKVLRGRMSPVDALKDGNLRHVLLKAGIKQLTKQAGVAAEPEQIQEVIEILETGRFFGDASAILAAVFHAVPGFPADILDDLEDPQLSRLPASLLEAVLRDSTGFPAEMKKAIKSMLTGSGGDRAQVLGNTLGTLKKLAVSKRAFVLLRAVLSKDNRSARLAIILYARANGVTVSEANIDKVYEALDPDNPSIGLPLREALEILGREYGGDAGIQVLKRLGPSV